MPTTTGKPAVQAHSGRIVHTGAATVPSLGMSNTLAVLGAAPWPKEPWWRRISPSTLFVLLSAALAVFFILHELVIAKALGFPTEESWVRVTYAQNFFHHLEFEYTSNVGGVSTIPHAGRPTSPFWIVVFSLAVNFFHDPILAGKLLGSIFLFLTGYYTFRLLRAMKLDYASSLLAGALVITTWQLAWSELSGLESTLSAALMVGGLWWYFSAPNKMTPSFQALVTGGIFALGTLTRPGIASVFLALLVWQACSREERTFWKTFCLLIGFVVILAPVAITNIAVGGSLVPSTFRGSLEADSVILLAWHGEPVRIVVQLFRGFAGVWRIIRDVYWGENPVWIFTIIAAFLARRRNPFLPRDAADRLFILSVFLLLAFPYLRSLSLGVDGAFGANGRLVHFMLPLYAIAGVLSLRVLARAKLFRSVSPKQFLFLLAGALLVTGVPYILIFQPDAASAISPAIECAMLLFFTALLLIAGFRRAGIPLWKPGLPHQISEQERNETRLTPREAKTDPHLAAPAVAVLHTALLIILAWNLTMLPRAANNFGTEVKQVNSDRVNTSIGMVLPLWHSQQIRGFERANFADARNVSQKIDANSRQAKF